MKKVTILGLYNSMASTVIGPMDLFNQAGRLWNRVNRTPATPFFEVALASPDGKAIRCANNVLIQPHCGISEIQQTDLLVISSATYIKEILASSPDLPGWIRRQYQQGAHVASICTGAFLLAETGLLDGKSATLHWGYANAFRRKYPDVGLEEGHMFLDHGRLYCSAGVSAGLDLSLYLVEKLCGRKAAVQSAKSMVLDLGRKSQAAYAALLPPDGQGDSQVQDIQAWLERNFNQNVDYDELARKFKMSRRSLERRFKQSAGMTPLAYLQSLRVERAKSLLEEGGHTFSEITYQVGYEDIAFFRKLFTRLTGLKPREYQQRFGR